MPQHILIVDNDRETVHVLRTCLEQAGYEVYFAYDGKTALHMLMRERPDMVILDWMLPDQDGLSVIRTVRGDPVLARTCILLMARTDDIDIVVGLEAGADDCITRPFNLREIVARVRSSFRRIELDEETAGQQRFRYLDLMLDLARRQVTLKNRVIDLTPTEFNLLSVLMRRPGVPFSRSELVQYRPGYACDSLERTLDSHIRNLRKKIEPDPTSPTYIQTVYGVGYRLGDS